MHFSAEELDPVVKIEQRSRDKKADQGCKDIRGNPGDFEKVKESGLFFIGRCAALRSLFGRNAIEGIPRVWML